MWRVQVWEGTHITEAFLVDTQSEALAKRDELRGAYASPHFDMKVEEIYPRSTYVRESLVALADFLFGILVSCL